MMWWLGGGLFLGWSIGANDAANVFGTAVASRVIRYRTAALLASAGVIAGAMLQGSAGLETLGAITPEGLGAASASALAGALAVTLMTLLRLPVSATQAVVGGIIGVSFWTGGVDPAPLARIVLCWIATPAGAMLVALALYQIYGLALRRLPISMLTRDRILWHGLIVAGIYGAYALGANNVANVTGVFYGRGLVASTEWLNFIGAAAIALGILTYSGRVMQTVGGGLIRLDAFAALVAVSAEAVTVHVFAVIGVPVSTSQAVVGGVLGVAIMRGGDLHAKVLRNIGLGWIITPILAAVIGFAGYGLW
ncbi:MAG: inorganic phosphate transporter [bacterium]|nr:inorganic phosphate transporter [bacterium]